MTETFIGEVLSKVEKEIAMAAPEPGGLTGIVRKVQYRPLLPGVSRWIISVDLGKRGDYTAIIVLEIVEGGRNGVLIVARYCERIPLKTPYDQVRRRIKEIVNSGKYPGAVLVCDATGVGEPAVDEMLVDGLSPIAFTLTGGGQAKTEKQERGDGITERRARVPKLDVVTLAQMLLEDGTLVILDVMPFADVLRKEMKTFKIRLSDSGRQRFGAWRDGEHDDLVLALITGAYIAWAAIRRSSAKPARASVKPGPAGAMSKRGWRKS